MRKRIRKLQDGLVKALYVTREENTKNNQVTPTAKIKPVVRKNCKGRREK